MRNALLALTAAALLGLCAADAKAGAHVSVVGRNFSVRVGHGFGAGFGYGYGYRNVAAFTLPAVAYPQVVQTFSYGYTPPTLLQAAPADPCVRQQVTVQAPAPVQAPPAQSDPPPPCPQTAQLFQAPAPSYSYGSYGTNLTFAAPSYGYGNFGAFRTYNGVRAFRVGNFHRFGGFRTGFGGPVVRVRAFGGFRGANVRVNAFGGPIVRVNAGPGLSRVRVNAGFGPGRVVVRTRPGRTSVRIR